MKKKVIKILSFGILGALIIFIIVVIGIYIGNREARNYIDRNILGKEVTSKELPQIMLEDNSDVYAYGSYVAVLNNNLLTIYNKNAKKITNIDVSVSSPKFASCRDYLLIADENDSKIYLIHNSSLEWQKSIEGKVSELTVNNKGAVAISLTETTYKTVIIMYDITGKESFKTYLSTSSVTDLDISEDCNYLSYIEISTSNIYVDSCVKTISVEKAKKDPANAIIYTYSLDNKTTLLINIKYNNQKLILYADDGIYLLEKGNSTKLEDIKNGTTFASINLDGFYAIINNNEDCQLQVSNVITGKKSTYIINDAVKSMYTNKNIIAINTGNKVEFIDTNGWLIKRFIATQNFKQIIIGDNLITIVYKDKVDVIGIW